MAEITERLKQIIEDIYPLVVEWRRDIHMNPELGFEETRTNQLVCGKLAEWGIEHRVVAKTGICALIEGTGAGNTVAIRADMDALPIQDLKDVPYKSRIAGKMHACGHDSHTATLLGVAKILTQIKNDFSGCIKLFFQPSEEFGGGAVPMIEAGVMENPEVDAVIGLHVFSSLPVGKISVKYDQAYAASDTFYITINGKSAHGANPHDGIDSSIIAAGIINSLQTIVSRNTAPTDSAVVTIGTINGGTKTNIIINRIEMSGTIRTINNRTRQMVKERLRQVVENCAAQFGADAEVRIDPGYDSLVNDKRVTDIIYQTGCRLLGEENVIISDEPTMGVEDFAYFAQKAPGCFYGLGVGNVAKGITAPGHNDYYDIDEDGMKIGLLMQIEGALALLKEDF